MAAFEFRLPDIGEGVAEGEVVQWHVQVGDVVAEDDPMVEVMTDKATVTIAAPKAGTIAELRTAIGDTAQVGDVLVVIETDAAAVNEHSANESPANEQPTKETAASAVGDIQDALPGSQFFSEQTATHSDSTRVPASAGAGTQQLPGYFEPRPLATPATRKLARDLEVDLRQVEPSGTGGRVTQSDIRAFTHGHDGQLPTYQSVPPGLPTPVPTGDEEQHAYQTRRTTPAPPLPSFSQPPGAQRLGSQRSGSQRPASPPPTGTRPGFQERRTPFVGLRRRIAERMQASVQTAAHFTFVEECDAEAMMQLRERFKEPARAQGVQLTYLPFIVKAVVGALRRHPQLNTMLDEARNEIVYQDRYDIGIATSTERGLMVPVLRDADRRSLVDLASEITRLGQCARDGTLTADELTGSTFTITSLGKRGGLLATPILNSPEVGILGIHQIKEKPVVRRGRVVVGHVMNLSLSFDHRIVDGHVGAEFAYDIIDTLADPDRLLLQV